MKYRVTYGVLNRDPTDRNNIIVYASGKKPAAREIIRELEHIYESLGLKYEIVRLSRRGIEILGKDDNLGVVAYASAICLTDIPDD